MADKGVSPRDNAEVLSVRMVYVEKESRKRGVGKKLFEALTARARELGVRGIDTGEMEPLAGYLAKRRKLILPKGGPHGVDLSFEKREGKRHAFLRFRPR